MTNHSQDTNPLEYAWNSPPKGNGAVMIVDDDAAVLTVGQAILSTLPYQVIAARSGEEAIDKLRAMAQEGRAPDLIILDLAMPGGMSGLDTLQEIRSIDPRIGIIACSGFFEQSAHDLCCALGFMDIIEKPYTPEVLTSMIRKCMTKLLEPESELGPLVRSMVSTPLLGSAESSS